MRKHLTFILDYYRNSYLSIILIFIVTTFAIFTLINVLGINEYITYTKNIYINSGLENALYFIPSKGDDYYNNSPDEAIRAADEAIKEKIKNKNGVDRVIVNRAVTGLYDNKFTNIIFYDNAMNNTFKINTKDDIWFDKFPVQNYSSNGYYDCIIGGDLFDGINNNDNIEISIGNNPMNLKVVNKMNKPVYIPQFFNGNSTDDLFVPLDNAILMYYTEDVKQFFYNIGADIINYENYFIKLNDNISYNERTDLYNLLYDYGIFYTYDDIIKNTNETNAYKIKTKLPFPIYSFLISTISLISIAILITNNKIKDYSIYYLCGCSKLKSIFYMSAALCLIGLVPCLLNICNIIFNPYLFRGSMSTINERTCYINNTMIIPVLIYLCCIIFISIIIPTIIYLKNPPIEIKRKTKQ